MNLLTKIQLIKLDHIQKCETAALKAYKAASKARGWNRRMHERTAESALANMHRDPLGVSYRPRLKLFKEHRVDFDFETGLGHSYDWYQIAKRIKGIQVLNTYNYSRQTSDHVYMLKNLFKQLGIKYICIESPKGLQDLESARKHILYSMALQDTKEKYSVGSPNRYVGAKHSTPKPELLKQLKALAKFNYAATDSMKRDAIELAESDRRWKLDRQAEQRRDKKAMAALIIEIDAENKKAGESALHIIKPHAWNWSDSNEYTGRIEDRERREAISKGFNKIIVHKTEPRILSVVSNEMGA